MALREVLSPSQLKPHLIELYEPITQGLYAYQEMADGALDFDLKAAAMLGHKEGKPNSARSETPVGSNGEQIGNLFVIAFQPEEGTGATGTHTLAEVSLEDGLPLDPKVLPRSKDKVAAELMMPLVAKNIGEPEAKPIAYDVTLDLLGIQKLPKGRKLVKKIGELGVDDTRRSATNVEVQPVAYHTVEPRSIINTGEMKFTPSRRGRIGNPHAIFSSRPDTLQVVAFLAISDEVAESNPDIFASINQAMPRKGPFLSTPRPVRTGLEV